MRPTKAQHDGCHGCHRRPTHPAPPHAARALPPPRQWWEPRRAPPGDAETSRARPSPPPPARSPGPDETAPAVARVLPLSAQPHDKDLGTKYTFSGYLGVQTAAHGPAGWTAGSTNHSSEMAVAVGAHSRCVHTEQADAPVAVHRPFRGYVQYIHVHSSLIIQYITCSTVPYCTVWPLVEAPRSRCLLSSTST